LRAIQERKIDRVGGQEAIRVQFRLITATHKNLEDMVKLGTFREDLFYRLNVIPFELPPLRLRNNDILELAESILQRLNQRYCTTLSFNNQQKQQLLAYTWPGNVRELENVLERSVVLSADHLEIDIPNISILENDNNNQFKTQKKDVEKKLIIGALEDCRWNKTKAADFLGISRRSLLYKIKEMDIE
jgi:transcriptional regulator with PAS, ATPase and Fis domain